MMSLPGLRSCLAVVVMVAVCVPAARCGELTGEERDRRLSEVHRLVRMGDNGAAALVLEDLYESAPYDPVVVKEFFGVLMDLGEFGRAEQMVKAYLAQKSHDVRAMSDLASLYFRTGRDAEGRETIDRIISEAPDERWPYEVSIGVLSRYKMEDDLLALIGRARTALADSTAFAMNAAKIHMEAGRHGLAAREYLVAGVAQGRSHGASSASILGMAVSDSARAEIIAALKAAEALDGLREGAAKVLWEVYLMDGDCGRSLEELRRLVASEKSFSKSFETAAKRSAEQGCYSECAQAYELAATYCEDRAKVPALLFEKGTCEEKGGSTGQALETFGRIVDKYPDTLWGSKASIARGRIHRALGDPETALGEVEAAIAARHAGDDERYAALLLKADCLIDLGRLDEAFTTYDEVEMDWEPAYAQEAFFNLGEIDFYKGDFEGAIGYYNVTLREFPDQPRANDAIDRLLLLKASGRGDAYDPGLKEFAAAVLLRRRGQTGEARRGFEDLASSGNRAIKVESLKSLAEVCTEEGDFDSAVRTYKVIGESLDTYFSPSALEAVGDIYRSLGETQQAISAYEDVILKFPDSVSAGEARRKIELVAREDSKSS
jgi:tetratricopeptide (TPR) repeat protein